jgi:hypothetical protein
VHPVHEFKQVFEFSLRAPARRCNRRIIRRGACPLWRPPNGSFFPPIFSFSAHPGWSFFRHKRVFEFQMTV